VVAEFWASVTGYRLAKEGAPPNEYWVAKPAGDGWPRLVFVTVPELKSVKNRVHLDLVPAARDQAAEVERMRALGATVVDDRRHVDPGGWVVMADPEGNEFCVE
jgi:predicted enzyme related to lactoylglutathione lyase